MTDATAGFDSNDSQTGRGRFYRIRAGSRVRLHLSIHLGDGTEALSSFDAEPLTFRLGDGTLAPGLESLLIDLPVGSDTQTLVQGADVFGEPDPALIQVLDPRDLPANFSPEVGQVLSFTTPGGQETAGTVLGIDDDGVRVDFNHPLSRRTLRVRIQVLDIA